MSGSTHKYMDIMIPTPVFLEQVETFFASGAQVIVAVTVLHKGVSGAVQYSIIGKTALL